MEEVDVEFEPQTLDIIKDGITNELSLEVEDLSLYFEIDMLELDAIQKIQETDVGLNAMDIESTSELMHEWGFSLDTDQWLITNHESMVYLEKKQGFKNLCIRN